MSFWFSRNPTPSLHQTSTSSASLEVLTPSALSRPEQRLLLVRPAFPTACASRLSQPPGTFIRSEPAGLISCRIRSWDHPPKLCPSDAAAHCFQRHSPLDVPTAFRVFLRARVRHSIQLFKLKTERVALLGLFPSRVLSPCAGPAFTVPPLMRLSLRAQAATKFHFRVFHAESPTGLSRDRRPSWGLWPSGRLARSSIAGFWSLLRKRLGFVTVP